MNEDLHIKYRPRELDELYGQDELVDSLKKLFKKSVPHAFLFEGASGCGKTTTARILAKMLGVDDESIIEMDVATKGGIDDSRALIENLRYTGFGKSPNKFVILDEVHAASKAFWQSLLKTLEDTPGHVYFALCTTESGKVPDTVRTRCHSYVIKPIRASVLLEMLESVVDAEGIEMDEEILRLISKESGGSARKALVNLSKCLGCKDVKQAKVLLESVDAEEDVIALCRKLVGREKFGMVEAVALVAKLKEKNAESVRIVIVNYIAAVILKCKKEGEIGRLVELLDNFSTPYNSSEKMAPLLLSLGNALMGE